MPAAKDRSIDVEGVFTSVSRLKAFGDEGPQPRLVLSPRSSQACLQTGVDPEHLRIRDLDSFWEPGLDPKVQRMRHEDYSMRRHDLMREVREARARLGKRSHGGARSNLGTSSADNQNSTAAQIEQRRLQKVQERQQREIEQMLAFEIKQAERQDEAARRLMGEQNRQKRMQRAKQKRVKEQQEARRLKELKKQAEIEYEERQKRKMAQEQFAREKELKALAQRRNKRAQAEARQRELERQQKKTEFKERTKRILKEQQDGILSKLGDMEEKERQRSALADEAQRQKQEILADRREHVKRRISQNHRALKKIESKAREDFATKQMINEERRRRLEEQQREEREHKRNEQRLNERKREMIVQEMKREERMRALDLMSRQHQSEHAIKQIADVRQHQHMLRRERLALKSHAKSLNVERQRRKDEFKRMQILEKLESNESRIKSMQDSKRAMVEQRKHAAIQTKIRKDHIVSIMDNMRTQKNWKVASKHLSSAMTPGAAPSPAPRKRGGKSRAAQRKVRTAAEARKVEALHRSLPEQAEVARDIRNSKSASGLNTPSQYVSPYEVSEVRPKSSVQQQAVPAFVQVQNDGTLTF